MQLQIHGVEVTKAWVNAEEVNFQGNYTEKEICLE